MKKDVFISPQKIKFPDERFRIYTDKRAFCKNDKAFHEAIEIKYYLSGSSAVMIDGDVFVASRGDITVVNPFELHANVNIEDYSGEYILLMVDLDFLKEFSPSGLDLRHTFASKWKRIIRFISGDERLGGIITNIYTELSERGDNYRLAVYSLVTELFVLLLREHTDNLASPELGPRGGKGAELIAPALSAIFENYRDQMSLDELAGLCNVSKYHFCRVFKEEMKMTVVQYVTSYRISLADTMLKESDKSIDSIAEECGFSDISYFYRCYRRLRGISPKKARTK
jgi:AraC-like DNA-binding protein